MFLYVGWVWVGSFWEVSIFWMTGSFVCGLFVKSLSHLYAHYFVCASMMMYKRSKSVLEYACMMYLGIVFINYVYIFTIYK